MKDIIEDMSIDNNTFLRDLIKDVKDNNIEEILLDKLSIEDFTKEDYNTENYKKNKSTKLKNKSKIDCKKIISDDENDIIVISENKKTILEEVNELFNKIDENGNIKQETETETKTEKVKTLEIFKKIVDNNEYVKNSSSNDNRDINSLSYLVKRVMSQSDCIKLGYASEFCLKDYILSLTQYINLKEKNKKGEKEKDHIFLDDKNKIIYYAELKANLNLDTEKSKVTVEKCIENKKNIEKEYPNHKVIMFLVGSRYYDTKKIIPENILSRYNTIKNSVVGINEYLECINCKFKFASEQEYKLYLEYLADKMYENKVVNKKKKSKKNKSSKKSSKKKN